MERMIVARSPRLTACVREPQCLPTTTRACRPQRSAARQVKMATRLDSRALALSSRRRGAGKPLSVRTRSANIQASTSPADMAAVDQLIDLLLEASEDEFPQAVAKYMMSCDQKFYLRIAARMDSSTEEQKTKLAELSSSVMRVQDLLVKQTRGQMNVSSEVLQAIVAAAADETTGEFVVPLADDKLNAMRQVIISRSEEVNESTIATSFAWIRKASEDRLDGMVVILQTVLQLSAAVALTSPKFVSDPTDAAALAVSEFLTTREEEWDNALERFCADESFVGEKAFQEELQRRMEGVVLKMPNGSYSQKAFAEFLKEADTRAKAAFRKHLSKGFGSKP